MIDGAKQFITNAGTDISGVVSITARTGESEISNLIVPNGTPGYEQDEPVPQDGLERLRHARRCASADCRVPAENLLGARGAGLRQFLTRARRRAHRRRGDGRRPRAGRARSGARLRARAPRVRPADLEASRRSRRKLADMSCEIEAARLLVYRAACEKDLGRDFSLTAAQAKLKTGRLAVRCAEEAVQIHGGYGYIEEYPVCRFYRDAKILTIGEGTDEIQQMVIAQGARGVSAMAFPA